MADKPHETLRDLLIHAMSRAELPSPTRRPWFPDTPIRGSRPALESLALPTKEPGGEVWISDCQGHLDTPLAEYTGILATVEPDGPATNPFDEQMLFSTDGTDAEEHVFQLVVAMEPLLHDRDPLSRAWTGLEWVTTAYARECDADRLAEELAQRAIALLPAVAHIQMDPAAIPALQGEATPKQVAIAATAWGRHHYVDPRVIVREAFGAFSGCPPEDFGL